MKGALVDVNPTWDQMQALLYNTGEDDFSTKSDALKRLSKGSHKVKVAFVRTVYTGSRKDLNDQGKVVEIKQYKPVNYTVGEFTFIVR